jgi:lauroyl/myristoyl acyltransferase
VELSPLARQAVDWAVRKQREEDELEALMKKHPGLRELHDQLEMMKVLCQEESEKQ